VLHNTAEKKQDRAMMLAGEKPAGCDYCWKIESIGPDAVSDRVYKSNIYEVSELHRAAAMDPASDVDLKTLEISFDRTCQFACSYCNPAFSTTWVKDIKVNGPYQNLISDGRNHFTHVHEFAQRYQYGEENPYVNAFFEWWETDLHKTLQELRVTGGEPLMSGYTWKLIEWFKDNQGRSNTKLAINSNLGLSKDKLKEFISKVEGLPHLEVYTSNEAVGATAEYIRDGLNYNEWMSNVEELLDTDSIKVMHVMCTINALCLSTLPNLLTQMLGLKQRYSKWRLIWTLNILRFPSFQSPLILPDDIKAKYRDNLLAWIDAHRDHPLIHDHEYRHLERLIDYLDVVKTPHPNTHDTPRLLNDFKQFYVQYDQRRGKDFVKTFPELEEWYNGL
jgi:organic radical activating enzyme